jgi:hypothetical protein
MDQDGSYTRTLAFASDSRPGPDGTSTLTFDGLTDGHTYSLQGQDANGAYTVFTNYPYHDLVPQIGVNSATGDAVPSSAAPSSSASGGSADGTAEGS